MLGEIANAVPGKPDIGLGSLREFLDGLVNLDPRYDDVASPALELRRIAASCRFAASFDFVQHARDDFARAGIVGFWRLDCTLQIFDAHRGSPAVIFAASVGSARGWSNGAGST